MLSGKQDLKPGTCDERLNKACRPGNRPSAALTRLARDIALMMSCVPCRGRSLISIGALVAAAAGRGIVEMRRLWCGGVQADVAGTLRVRIICVHRK